MQTSAVDGRDGGRRSRGSRRRQEAIRERVLAEGFVRLEELAREFNISTMTVHRDLDELQRQGWLRKIRGGATSRPSALYHGDVRYRLQAETEAKQELARSALPLVGDAQVLMLDDSTTVLHLARLLPSVGPLTVVTNFLAIINALAGEAGIDLMAIGGVYYPAYDAFLGIQAVEAIRPLRADIAFLSTTAIVDGACYHQSHETVQVKRALMAAAKVKVLLVDHTKFGRRALHRLESLASFDHVIVDSRTASSDVEALSRLGVRVVVAKPEEHARAER
ncbi:MAG TPA: DeoR/GlpR family DNA-binding transcription regulator [Acidimicrobiales bacterium]|nr:DeoR/GlpR family DNA-binding transcription regulator [Acidimicrobiales bacterium]